MANTFQTEKYKKYTLKIRALLSELPLVCGSFFRSIESQTSVLTRYGYAVDLRGFFQFAVAQDDLFPGKTVPSLTVTDLEKIRAYHIELYLNEVSLYQKGERELVNQEISKARKLSTLRSFFKYLHKQEMLQTNVAALVDIPKLYEKAIVRLEPNEVADLLDLAENGEGLSERQKKYHAATKLRDVAILTLFLGTGIRISELVGIDLDDIDLENDAFVVTRKGGSEDILSFGNEVHRALEDYLRQRENQTALPGHENALFLSMQMRRITARAVENLVKKYARLAAPLKKITPHKLRSTYGTMLYHETEDIYLVADVLGHKDVNTTRKHYAATSEEHKRIAAKKIRLRDD
ncbi:MAG TPA: tyrosine-type recombinase/integrase [Eubacteriales bacterium]|nr:tyrosine-type recombinase/integrase [Eubacteriales bacterium]